PGGIADQEQPALISNLTPGKLRQACIDFFFEGVARVSQDQLNLGFSYEHVVGVVTGAHVVVAGRAARGHRATVRRAVEDLRVSGCAWIKAHLPVQWMFRLWPAIEGTSFSLLAPIGRICIR